MSYNTLNNNLNTLLARIETARTNLKNALSRKGVSYNSNDTLRRLISLIPKKISKPADLPYTATFMASVALGNKVHTMGGYQESGGDHYSTSTHYMYSFDSKSYTSKSSLPYAIWGHSAIKTSNNIVISGGITRDYNAYNVIRHQQYVYNSSSNSFSENISMINALVGHSSVSINDGGLIVSGRDSRGTPQGDRVFYNYSSRTSTTKISCYSCSYLKSCVTSQGVLTNGGLQNSSQNYNVLYNYNSNTSANKQYLPTSVYSHTTTSLANNAFISGGYYDGSSSWRYVRNQYLFNVGGNSFTSKIDLPINIIEQSSVNIDDFVLMSGGSIDSRYTNRQMLYNYQGNRFE